MTDKQEELLIKFFQKHVDCKEFNYRYWAEKAWLDGWNCRANQDEAVRALVEAADTVANNLGEFASQMQTQRQADQLNTYATELFAALDAVRGK